MKITYIFRASHPFFYSIERVFDVVSQPISEKSQIKSLRLPKIGFSLKNLLYIFKKGRLLKKPCIFHVTGDVHYIVAALAPSRTVLTIHDLVFLQHYKGYKRYLIKWLYLDMPVRRVAVITTISEKSKREILKYTNCDPSKIKVIPNPVSQFIEYSHGRFNTSNPVILFIGSSPNKNLNRIITALNGISCTFRIIGRVSDLQRTLLLENSISFSEASGLTEDELNEEYQKSDIVIFPSLYEGFGLPIIEAQKAGRVIITSNISPMMEVSGGAACLVDPYSVESIKKGVLKVIENESYRNDLIENGLKNIERFLPQKIADQYLSVYRNIIDKT